MAHDLQFGQFVCQKFFIFWKGWMMNGTRSPIWAICVPKISHFFLLKFPEAEPAWHTNLEKTDLCAKFDRDRLGRQRRRKQALKYLRNCHHDKPCGQQTKAGASRAFYKTFRRNMKRAQGQKRLRLRPSAAKIIAIYYVLVKNAEAGM